MGLKSYIKNHSDIESSIVERLETIILNTSFIIDLILETITFCFFNPRLGEIIYDWKIKRSKIRDDKKIRKIGF